MDRITNYFNSEPDSFRSNGPPLEEHQGNDSDMEIMLETVEQITDTQTSGNHGWESFYNAKSPEWGAFWRSTAVCGKNRRRKAKCKHCNAICFGEIKKLREHIEVCNAMTGGVRQRVTHAKHSQQAKAKETEHQVTLPDTVTQNISQQDICDNLMGMFLITSDIPFK